MMLEIPRAFSALLIVVCLSVAATGVPAFTDPSPPEPDPFCSMTASSSPWNIEAAEPEWPPSRPAAKVLAEACASVDVTSLEGEALIDYLRTTSEGCMKNNIVATYTDLSRRKDLPVIFSDRNMQSVFAEIEELSAAYDGSNSTGMAQLWSFVELGYSYYKYWPNESGVGPFDEATDRAYIAASNAFAASDHFLDHNDEATRILYSYFEVGYAAGLRQNHLGPIKQVLTGFTPERAADETQAYYSFSNVINRVYWTFSDHDEGRIPNPGFIDAVSKDPEFVNVMLQVTRYDFFFLSEEDHPSKPRKTPLERVLYVLARLTRLESLRETAVTALTSVLSWHQRLSGPFLIAAKGLEDQVDCASLNICRDVLESEIYARALTNKYSLDGGALVFDTFLPREEVQPMYQGAREIKARFHRLVETDEPAVDGLEVFTTRMYATKYDYLVFEAYLGGVNTRQFSGAYYSNGTMATSATPADERGVGDNRDHVDTFYHEYGHYLADRFGLLKFGDLWFDEGLAEFLNSRSGAAVRYAAISETRPDPAELFKSEYRHTFEDKYHHNFSRLFFQFMRQLRRTALLELLDLVRSGDYSAYKGLIETWAQDAQLAADYDRFLDEQVAKVGSLPDPSFTYILPGALTSDSAAEIESVLQLVDGDLGMNCQSVDTESEHGFVCTGSLPAESGFSGDRGALNAHLNARLDAFLASAVEDGEINNFEDMTCYFTDVAGSPPVADLRCEGPLRPEGLAQGQVDLMASLFKSGAVPSVYVGERPIFAAGLSFAEETASNVTMTWTASLPVAELNAISSVPCEVVEATGRTGKIACGHVHKMDDGPSLSMGLVFYPLQAGSLEFSVEFSSDEPEIEPADNVASLQLMVARIPQHIATLSGHTDEVNSVAFSPDSTTLASGSRDGTVRLWDVGLSIPAATLEEDAIVRSVAFSPDGRTLAAGLDDGAVKLWDLETGTNTASFEGEVTVNSVAFSPDGGTLAAGLDGGTVKLWDVETEANRSTFSWLTHRVASVMFSSDGRTLAAGLEDGTVKLWEVGTESNFVTLSGHALFVNSVAFSPDGTTLASGSGDGTVKLWDVATETNTITFDLEYQVWSVAISPDGNILAAGLEDATIRLLDLETGRELTTFAGHVFSVRSLAFSPDGTMLASAAGRYKPVQLWDVSEWTVPRP